MLNDSEKWSLRDNESPPKKGFLVNLEDDEESDKAPKEGRNMGKPLEIIRRKRESGGRPRLP